MTPDDFSEQELRENAALVAELGRVLKSKDASIETTIKLIKHTIKKKAWTHFITAVNEEVTYPDTPEGYCDFITTPRIEGLGTRPEIIAHIVEDDDEASRMHRDSITPPPRKPRKDENSHNIVMTIQGNSKSYGLEVLHDKHPEMYEKVLLGEISVHKALIEVGERKPTATVPVHSMPRLAAALKRRLGENERLELIRLLSHEAE